MIQPLKDSSKQWEQRDLAEWYLLHLEYVRALERDRRDYSATLSGNTKQSSDKDQFQTELPNAGAVKSFEEFRSWWVALPESLRERLECRYEAGLARTLADGKEIVHDAIRRRRHRD